MKTFFSPKMSAEGNNSFSPSAAKPALLMDFLRQQGIELDMVDDFLPCSREQIKMAHEEDFVDGVLDLTMANGFGNCLKTVADSLLYTTGSFLAASEFALNHRQITFSPTSGFHHANYANPSGFCTFNGLIIAAMHLKKLNPNIKIGIIDCDQHYGDGTEYLMQRHRLDYIRHYTFGAEKSRYASGKKWLTSFAEELNRFKDVDIIFYQAGADPHINDPLGGTLTTEEMLERDILLFSFTTGYKIPVVWNLAGGYQRPIEEVLKLHFNTYKVAANCAADYSK